MSFLPIVERELQVAARRKTTFRTRLIFAGTGVGIVALLLTVHAFAAVIGTSGSRPIGDTLFTLASSVSTFLALFAGVFLTADTLSWEKREGTLGLLFLTHLSNLDVILGKLAASSLVAAHGLLAVLPVFAIALTGGGVTAGEFWRMALVLPLTLLLSLSLGLCASAACQDQYRAMALTAGFALLLAAVPLGPYSLFTQAFDTVYALRPQRFWWAAGTTFSLSSLLLAVAAFILSRSWRSGAEPANSPPAFPNSIPRLNRSRPAHRKTLLSRNPIDWLASRRSTRVWTLLGFVLLAGIPVVAWLDADPSPGTVLSTLAAGTLALVLQILIGLRACRFFADARRDGTLEFLLATPVSPPQILEGLQAALRRDYGLAVVAASLVPAATALLSGFADAQPASTALPWVVTLLPSFFFTARVFAAVYAAAWVGALVGLTVRRPASAPWFTLLFTLILPLPFGCLTTLLYYIPALLWARPRVLRKLQQLSRPQSGLTLAHLLAPVPPPPAPPRPPQIPPP